MNNDFIKCGICNCDIKLHLMNAHIKYEHLLDINQYYNQYHNVNFTKENYQFNGKDVVFILQIRELFPQFNNDTEILQYIYDTNEYCFDTISKIYDIKNINQLCYNFDIKINYDLSEYHKRRISEGSIGKVLSKEHKQAISDGLNNIPLERKKKIYKQISESNKGKTYSRESIEKMIANRTPTTKGKYWGKCFVREDLGHLARSTWEANYARILKYLNISYEFEKTRFWVKLDNGRESSYTPDFKIGNTFIEIKGYWMSDAIEKHNLFKIQYPDVKVIIIDGPIYFRLKKHYHEIIPNWEY